MIRVDMPKLQETAVRTTPYAYLIVPGFVPAECRDDIDRDFPAIDKPGSFPLEELTCGPQFTALIDRLRQNDFRDAIAAKFDIDLTGKPMTCTVRGATQLKDGQIHTDSTTKLITVLIYLNPPSWQASGGRLRVLNSGDNLEDYAEEVEPAFGNMLIFRRSDTSWHGHEPFQGQRRTIQINWVTSQAVADRERARHQFSARLKRFNPFASKAS